MAVSFEPSLKIIDLKEGEKGHGGGGYAVFAGGLEERFCSH